MLGIYDLEASISVEVSAAIARHCMIVLLEILIGKVCRCASGQRIVFSSACHLGVDTKDRGRPGKTGQNN